MPVPFASYHPGPTFDVLGETDGKEIIQVTGGQKTYRDDGEIRMTTVSVSPEDADKNLFEVMGDWLDPDDAVYPYDVVHPPRQDPRAGQEVEGQVQMVSSQDTAIAAALRELDYEVTPALEVPSITPGLAGRRRARGARHLRLGRRRAAHRRTIGRPPRRCCDAIRVDRAGPAAELTVLRDGKEVDRPGRHRGGAPTGRGTVTGAPQIGIQLGLGFIFPFPVTVNIDPTTSAAPAPG